MTKTDISKMLQKLSPDRAFMNTAEIGKALGMGQSTTRTLLHDLDYLPSGREKRYLISDVAEHLATLKRRY